MPESSRDRPMRSQAAICSVMFAVFATLLYLRLFLLWTVGAWGLVLAVACMFSLMAVASGLLALWQIRSSVGRLGGRVTALAGIALALVNVLAAALVCQFMPG